MGVEDLASDPIFPIELLLVTENICAEGKSLTEVRSGTITLRKQSFDPHKLNCGATTTFLPLQLSPDLYIKQSSLQTPSHIQTGRNGVGLGSKRIFTSGEIVGRTAEIAKLFGSVCYLFSTFFSCGAAGKSRKTVRKNCR